MLNFFVKIIPLGIKKRRKSALHGTPHLLTFIRMLRLGGTGKRGKRKKEKKHNDD